MFVVNKNLQKNQSAALDGCKHELHQCRFGSTEFNLWFSGTIVFGDGGRKSGEKVKYGYFYFTSFQSIASPSFLEVLCPSLSERRALTSLLSRRCPPDKNTCTAEWYLMVRDQPLLSYGLGWVAEMSMDLDLDFFGQDLGFFAGLGFEILASTGFGFGFTDFFDNFAKMLENVEMTNEPDSSFECFPVIIHFFHL